MLDNKGKKTFLIVVWAVCSVSLVVALIGALVSALNMMINMDKVFSSVSGYTFRFGGNIVMLGGLLLGLFVLGVLFIVLCATLKSKIKLCSLILGAITVAYVTAITIVAYVKIPHVTNFGNSYLNYYGYSVFETFLSVGLSIAVPIVLSTISLLLLSKLNDSEQTAVANADETKV